MKKDKIVRLFLLVFAFLLLSTGKSVSAEDKSTEGTWKSKTYFYFYDADGKKTKGLYKIDGKTYYFDKEGRQKTGWQKIGSSYYYFRIANGEKGYMVTSKKVNGITLDKKGKAKKTKTSLKKLKTLVMATELVEKATKPSMTKSRKMKVCFNSIIKNYKYKGSPTFSKTSQWECDYAISMFTKKHGSCYDYGAQFAFVANAIGCKKAYAVSSGGHGWAEVDGYVYDLAWEQIDKQHSYFKRSYNAKTGGLAPNYKRARNYVRKI